MDGPGKQVYWISGASGSLGTALTLHLLEQGNRVRAFARNEHRLADLLDKVQTQEQRDLLSCQPGNVENLERVKRSMKGCSYVIHTAAMKRIDTCEYSPEEANATNIGGTENVINAALDRGIERAVFISSDKATGPTHYGKTKAAAEHLWLNANHYSADGPPYFVAVRYGNVWNSRGSVLEAFQRQAPFGRLRITDPQSTRFHWLLSEAAQFVLRALHNAKPGELWIPKLKSYRLEDLCAAYMRYANLGTSPEIIGLRLTERLHERMFSDDESPFISAESLDGYILTPGKAHQEARFDYSSGDHHVKKLSRADLEILIRETLGAHARV